MGFFNGEGTYLKDGWNVLDFMMVVVQIINWVIAYIYENKIIGFFRVFRCLRALRPLRVVSKNEGIKTVVNSLIRSIPGLLNVMLIICLFLVVFGILGVQLWKGG